MEYARYISLVVVFFVFSGCNAPKADKEFSAYKAKVNDASINQLDFEEISKVIGVENTPEFRANAALAPPTYASAKIVPSDPLIPSYPDNIIVYPPEPPRPEFVAAGPPEPTESATGSMKIGLIHAELRKIYDDCTIASNAAFRGNDPEQGDTTHNHLNRGNSRLKPRNNWRCGGNVIGVSRAYDDILEYRCENAFMAAEERCFLPKHAQVEQEYFKCENEKENFVRLSNYFFYNLEINSGLNISRNLYQTAEIRVYCDRSGGWDGLEQVQKTGHIKVVQLAPFSKYGGPGLVERLLPTAERRVVKGLEDQYLGMDSHNVAKMNHIIDVESLSGSPCSSLGISGRRSIPFSEREIIWDIPVGVGAVHG